MLPTPPPSNSEKKLYLNLIAEGNFNTHFSFVPDDLLQKQSSKGGASPCGFIFVSVISLRRFSEFRRGELQNFLVGLKCGGFSDGGDMAQLKGKSALGFVPAVP